MVMDTEYPHVLTDTEYPHVLTDTEYPHVLHLLWLVRYENIQPRPDDIMSNGMDVGS